MDAPQTVNGYLHEAATLLGVTVSYLVANHPAFVTAYLRACTEVAAAQPVERPLPLPAAPRVVRAVSKPKGKRTTR